MANACKIPVVLSRNAGLAFESSVYAFLIKTTCSVLTAQHIYFYMQLPCLFWLIFLHCGINTWLPFGQAM